MKKLYIHIGNPKTATTALQRFCYDNHSLLKSQGIYYPVDYCHASGPHYEVTWAVDNNDDAFFERLNHDFISSGCDMLLISSEMFSTPRYQSSFAIDRVLKMFKKIGFKLTNINIILFLRRQDEYFESIYNERVKNHALTKKIMETTAPLDYSFLLGIWSEFLGKNNIFCLDYGSRKLSVVEAFCETIGYHASGKESISSDQVNHKMYPLELEAVRMLNKEKIPIDDRHALNEYVRDVIVSSLTDSEKMNSSLLTEDQQKQIRNRYLAVNQFISDEYLDGEPLFCNDEYCPSYSEGVSEKRVIELMSKVIVSLWSERNPKKAGKYSK